MVIIMSINNKKEICQYFFNDLIKPKHLKPFEQTTPEGNIISGFICKKANRYLGSMVITHIKTKSNEFDTLQFVQAMPKIHYYDSGHKLFSDGVFIQYNCYEKLDGSCLILYPIFDNVNQLIEIVPKTRGVAVADKHILAMFNHIDKENIKAFFNDYPSSVLLFELYGILNKHEISHMNCYIDIALLGVIKNNEFLSDFEVQTIATQYGFKRPNIFYTITYYDGLWSIVSKFTNNIRFYDNINEAARYSTQFDMIQELKDSLTDINEKFHKNNGFEYTEGIVIYGLNEKRNHMFMKVKPANIEEKCRTQNGIPRKFIKKELNKYFDEYGSQSKELYQKNPTHYFEYVIDNLSEEFDSELIQNPKTTSRIEKMFLDMLEARVAPIGIQELCHKLVNEYPDYDVKDLMRVFAQEYPEKKRHARMVYSVLETMVM